MVTNNVRRLDRFKSRMGDSSVEKYISARKRRTASPKCLFGSPNQEELREYLLEHDSKELSKSNEKLEKYDLGNIDKNLLIEEGNSDTGTTSNPGNARGSLKFRPTIITDSNPAPAKNLFAPIEKIQPSTGTSDVQFENTENWRTAKRSSENITEETISKSPRIDNKSTETPTTNTC